MAAKPGGLARAGKLTANGDVLMDNASYLQAASQRLAKRAIDLKTIIEGFKYHTPEQIR